MWNGNVCVVSLLAIVTAACGGGVQDTNKDGIADCEVSGTSDGEDLSDTDGDPSVDLQCANVEVSGTTATFEVYIYGTWPPPLTYYSWFVECSLFANGTPLVATTTQRHDGQDSTYQVPPGATATVTPGTGLVTFVIENVPGTATHFNVKSGIQKTSAGTRVTDELAASPIPIPQ